MNSAKKYITICPRCDGTGTYDRGGCFECRQYGALGYVLRATKRGRPCFVTAIRNEKEGRIPWVEVYGNADPAQAVAIVQRTQRVRGLPDSIIASVQATT